MEPKSALGLRIVVTAALLFALLSAACASASIVLVPGT